MGGTKENQNQWLLFYLIISGEGTLYDLLSLILFKIPQIFLLKQHILGDQKQKRQRISVKEKKEDSYIKERELESKDQFTGINNANCYKVVRNQNVHLIKRQTSRYIQGEKENVSLLNSCLQAIAGFLLNNYTLLVM